MKKLEVTVKIRSVVTVSRLSESVFSFGGRLTGNWDFTIGLTSVTEMEMFWLQLVAPSSILSLAHNSALRSIASDVSCSFSAQV